MRNISKIWLERLISSLRTKFGMGFRLTTVIQGFTRNIKESCLEQSISSLRTEVGMGFRPATSHREFYKERQGIMFRATN